MAGGYLALNEKTGAMVEKYLLDEQTLEELVSVFSLFADKTRLRILSVLTVTPTCVTDLSNLLKINQTTVSHQLRLMRNIGAVNCFREGKIIYYSLKSEVLGDIILKGMEFLS
ncbi:MAG: winged helix-turn-helix transcriptional regulator [Clostridiales bacterium]|nr:winged helix-turn-helix transcriptional regulator [Clostridiales bacterium]